MHGEKRMDRVRKVRDFFHGHARCRCAPGLYFVTKGHVIAAAALTAAQHGAHLPHHWRENLIGQLLVACVIATYACARRACQGYAAMDVSYPRKGRDTAPDACVHRAERARCGAAGRSGASWASGRARAMRRTPSA